MTRNKNNGKFFLLELFCGIIIFILGLIELLTYINKKKKNKDEE